MCETTLAYGSLRAISFFTAGSTCANIRSNTRIHSPCDDGPVCIERSQFCDGIRDCPGNENDENTVFCFNGI